MITRHRLSGRLTVALPPDRAFRLFTPRGEEAWAPDWRPHFPDPVDDDSAPGTIFLTGAHGEATIWVVTERDPGRHIAYARVTPHARTGTVRVELEDADGHTDVTVSYDLTALTDAAAAELGEFAAGYPAFLRSWQDAIDASLRTG
jgi:hypothetical protein